MRNTKESYAKEVGCKACAYFTFLRISAKLVQYYCYISNPLKIQHKLSNYLPGYLVLPQIFKAFDK